MDNPALRRATLFGAALQVVMVLVAKFLPAIGGGASFLPAVGTALAALAGVRFSRAAASGPVVGAATGGLAAGGLSSLVGSALAGGLGLAPGAVAQTIGIATVTGAVAGACGGIAGRLLLGRRG